LGLKGAVNATLVENRKRLQQAVTVSPKSLGAAKKTERWDALWLPVTVHEQQIE
jgi:hypothetical protein